MKSIHMLLYFCLLFLFHNVLSASDNDFIIVNTSSGKVKGYKQNGVYEFYGIPYAFAPTGVNKFKAPLAAPIWLEPFEATVKGIICPQNTQFLEEIFDVNIGTYQIKENCLIANVFVPAKEKKNLPVIVIVHGGAYQFGTGEQLSLSDFAAQGEVIAITFNYRLGVHGFLCLGTEDVPGNAGMKDMVALLRWVKMNVGNFGGNPEDVTIIGHSAGSSAVDLLMLSGAAEGLFNKVVPESGNAINVWSVQIDPVKTALDYARSINFTSNDLNELQEFYKTASIDLLTMDNFMDRKDSTVQMVPCVERDTGSERFLKDSPYNILKKGDFKKVPYLIGFANMEGLFRAPLFEIWKDDMNKNFEYFLPADLDFDSEEEKKNVAKTVKEFYFGANDVNQDNKQGYIDFFSDVMFVYPALRTIKLMSEAGAKSMYLYEYTYSDQSPVLIPRAFPDINGAGHCEQTFALYISQWVGGENNFSDDFKRMRSMMRDLWINFVKTGKPVPESSVIFPSGWPTTSSKGVPYMDLNLVPKIISSPLHKERMEFWDAVYDKYYRVPKPPSKPVIREEL